MEREIKKREDIKKEKKRQELENLKNIAKERERQRVLRNSSAVAI
jgi:hypothetical protein